MLNKTRKSLLAIAAVSASALVLAIGVIGFSANDNIFKAFAEQAPISLGTISFSKDDTTPSGTTTSTVGYTEYNNNLLCVLTDVDSSQSSGHMGAVKSGTVARFYEMDGVTEYTFEDLEKITIRFPTNGTPAFSLKGYYDSGEEFSYSYSANTSVNYKTINFHSYGNVARIRVEFTSGTKLLDKLEILYNCNSKYQTGVEITTAPTKTTYLAGQSFDPSGMLVKAVYSNRAKIAATEYSISPSGALSTSDTYVTISYKGFSVQQPISVISAQDAAVGSYRYNTYGYFITLNNDGTGTNYTNDNFVDLTWTYNGSSLVLTASEVKDFAGSAFFANTTVTATNVSFNDNMTIKSFKVYVRYSSDSLNLTFTRYTA